ncbi:MAG: hypothetical protein K1X78_08730 [Verrucomicrobiaceae bacterium]|nr:hypothetical protein [Verrucomicrobiaceae bacterium]
MSRARFFKATVPLGLTLIAGAVRVETVKPVNPHGTVIKADLLMLEGEEISISTSGRTCKFRLDQFSK